MKRNVITFCFALAVLSKALCVFAQPAADQPAENQGMGRGQDMGGARGERGQMGEGGARGERGARGGGARGGGGRGGSTGPVDETGFVEIFDGETLNGWLDDGEGRWTVEDGAIVGQTTAENPLTSNSFLVWQGGKPSNFELKVEYRIFSGNSGVQYRSYLLEDTPYRLGGYQADITPSVSGVGLLFGEGGAGGFLAPAGTIAYRSDLVSGTLGSLGEAEDIQSVLTADGWNDLHIIVRGNTLIQIYNDRVFSILVDDRTTMAKEGLIGLQIHVGQPMRVEYRNIRLKEFQ